MEPMNSLPSSISHKELNTHLKKARKDLSSCERNLFKEGSKKDSFDELITSWSSCSKKLLNELNQKESNLVNRKNRKSLMALGALEAYLSMALQAWKASEIED